MDHKKTYRKIMQIIANLERKKGVTIPLKEMIELAIKHGTIKEIKNVVRIKDIIKEVDSRGICKENALSILKGLKEFGEIYEPKKGFIKRL